MTKYRIFNALMRHPVFFSALFVLLIVAENYIVFFYSIPLGQQGLNAVCYFISSLLIGLLLIGKFYRKRVERLDKKNSFSVSNLAIIGAALVCIVVLGIMSNKIFHAVAIDYKISDIIPSIQILVKRLLNGELVYRPIDDFGYHFYVTRLPLQWIVFTPAEWLGFDYRWISYGIWALAAFWIVLRTLKVENLLLRWVVVALLFGAYYLIMKRGEDTISNTVESMIAGFYMLFIMSLNSRKALIHGAAITLCLLSRYSLVLWLPLWAFILFITDNRKLVLKAVITVFVLVLLIYVIPFLSKNWDSIINGYQYYTGATLGEWKAINPATGRPYQLSRGVGIAFLFRDYYQDNLALGLTLLRYTHLVMCSLTVLLLGVWFWYHRKDIHSKLFLMASFKIYLTVFLFFIQIPYVYLMIVANFVSIAIFVEQMRYKIHGPSVPPVVPENDRDISIIN